MKNKMIYNIVLLMSLCLVYAMPATVFANESQENQASTSVGIKIYKDIEFDGYVENHNKDVASVSNTKNLELMRLFPKTNSVTNKFTSVLGMIILSVILFALIVRKKRRHYE